MKNDLPDDELIDVPEANIAPGMLTHAFEVKASHTQKQMEAEQAHQLHTDAAQGQTKEAEERELQERETRLLQGIARREEEIREEAELLDKRTIKLDDGRRVYVDGDKYRDSEGRELDDADRAQAEVHHLYQPNAATWKEHSDLQTRWNDTEKLRVKAEALQENGAADEPAKIAAYEKEFQTREASRAAVTPAIGSSNSDYLAAYGLATVAKPAGPSG